MEMNTKQLKYVVLLSRAGSFSAAAEELGISQPSLSQYIKKIEGQLGAELFDRINGSVRLTDAGRVYVDRAQKILNLQHELETGLSDLSANKSGSVIVGTSPYRSAAMMPEIARRFRALYPGMHLVVEEAGAAELLEEAEKGRYDLCLTMLPVDERLFSYELITEEELVIASPRSREALPSVCEAGRRYPVIDLRELSGRDFVMITESQVMQRRLLSLCAENGLTLQTAAVVKSLEAQICMVRSGLGMALVPAGIEAFCREDEVRYYSVRQPLPRRQVVALWRRDRALPAVVSSLLDIMKQLYR